MSTAFSIGEALASGFKLARARPLHVWAWGVVGAAPALIAVLLMLKLFGTLSPEALSGEGPPAEFIAEMIQFQIWSGLLNILQALMWVVVASAVFRAILFPDRATPYAGLKVGMDEVRVAVVGLAMIVALYAAMFVILLIAFAFGAALWFVSEAAAVTAGLLVACGAGLALWWLFLRCAMIMPASVALNDFAFVPGWKLARGQELRLLVLSVAIVFIVLAIELALFAVGAVILFLTVGANLFSLLAAAEQGATPDIDWGALLGWGLVAFVPLSWLHGFLNTVMLAPYAQACRSLLAQQPQDATPPVELG